MSKIGAILNDTWFYKNNNELLKVYNITIHNYGNPYKMIVDGKEIDGSIIPYNKNDKDVNVEIFM